MERILSYYDLEDGARWLDEIGRSDWGAGKYLHELLEKGELRALCGESTEVLLLADGDELVSFCTYAEQDDVREPSLTPWVGFVYTFPKWRGRRKMGKLLEYAENLAARDGHKKLYVSTNEVGLYEKYGFSFWKVMKDVNGEDSRVYVKEVEGVSRGTYY